MSEQYNYYEHYTLDANFVPDDTKYPDKDISLVPGKIIVFLQMSCSISAPVT